MASLTLKEKLGGSERQLNQTSLEDVQLRQKAFDTIIELLGNGGYFRALVGSLMDFDRVVGGLCWAITASGFDVNVDLFFQENAQIGQRIKLTENIISALRTMECPAPLQAHQVTGLDYPCLLPVIKWLLSAVNRNRIAIGDTVRSISMFQFKHTQKYHDEVLEDTQINPSIIKLTSNRYAPKRRFKLDAETSEKMMSESEIVRIRSCLLEYGEQIRGESYEQEASNQIDDDEVVSRDARAFDKQFSKAVLEAKQESVARESKVKEIEEAIKAKLTRVEEHAPISTFTSFLDRSQTDILQSEQKTSSNAESGSNTSLECKRSHQDQLTILQKQLQHAKDKLSSAESDKETIEKTFGGDLNEVRQQIEQLEKKRDELQQGVEAEFGKVGVQQLSIIEELVQELQQLKLQETKFKSSSRTELEVLENTKEKLKSEKVSTSEQQIMSEFDTLKEKYAKSRILLAEQIQASTMLQRKIDEVPTHAELVQYERRFVELYELVALKLEENRKHVATYNTLEETYKLMEQEVSILDSIHDTFQKAMKSPLGREQFFGQLQKILESLKMNLERATQRKLVEEKNQRVLQGKHDKLVDYQRKYYKAVRTFESACLQNEELLGKLESTL